MELRPVRKYQVPAFPSKHELNATPDLLRSMPQRWQRNAAIGSLLALGIAAGVPALRAVAQEPEPLPIAARVAPLFPIPKTQEFVAIAGGIGYQPKFLSEEEARKIINEELALSGLEFKTTDTAIFNVPMTAIEGDKTILKNVQQAFDGVERKKHFNYEFVSQADIAEWQKDGITPLNGQLNYEGLLHEGLMQRMPAGVSVVFYDPATQPLRGVSLNQQVKEFITWLKAEGVL